MQITIFVYIRNLMNYFLRGEFASFMLVAMQKVEKADIDQLRVIFDNLDTDKSDFLTKADLQKAVRKRLG